VGNGQFDLADLLMSLSGMVEITHAPCEVKVRHAGPSAVLRLDSSRHPGSLRFKHERAWIPACARMTGKRSRLWFVWTTWTSYTALVRNS